MPSTLRSRQWGAEAGQTKITAAADDVDFTNNALADQGFVRGGDHIGDKLVPENAFEAHVPFGDFQIGRTDPSLADAHQCVAVLDRRIAAARIEGERLVEGERAH